MKNIFSFQIKILCGLALAIALAVISVLGPLPHIARAEDTSTSTQQSVEDLNQKIKDRNLKIQQLESEINQYKGQVTQIGQQANTLTNAIKSLDTSGKQLQSELALTSTNIDQAQLSIEELGIEIGTKEEQIAKSNIAIAETIRTMNEADSTSMLEVLLTQPDLASMWNDIEILDSLNKQLNDHISELKGIQTDLHNKQQETAQKKQELADYESTLADKKQLVEVNKQQKATLLAQTKDQESQYKKLLAQKQEEEKQFQNELFQYESQLSIVLDKSKITATGSSALFWPLDHFTVTQLFGKTVDAQRLYANGTHNGVDLAVPVGTPIKAALAGTVQATGNTDLQPGCYSYGKWVLIKHANGLSTLYGHMSLIKATAGQTVNTGDIIGYSGQTGYATGPHVHFTVYASQGVSVQQYTSSIGCKLMSIPIAAPEAYLDPMKYLPQSLPQGAVK